MKIFNNKGQAMLLTVLVLGASILAASTIAGYLTLLKIRTASDVMNSTKAIFAADTGVEWELYVMFKDPTYPQPVLTNGATFTATVDNDIIKSVGQSSEIFRAFETSIQGATSTVP